MAKTFHLQVVVQDRAIFDGQVISIVAPGESGYLGVLANHAPLLATLGTGRLRVRAEKEVHDWRLAGGFLEVLHDEVTVLADRVVGDAAPSAP